MNPKNEYVPAPADTRAVEIPRELAELAEMLSKNTHEVWARTRFEQGWRWGETRDDARKLHPCLIPYEELSEDEKTFDRNTALETIRLILALGFRISR
ncbi:MAG: RyR domain-containing protein [Candidatus Spyradosoma sp.]